MKGCRTIAEYAIKKWMEDNKFVMGKFSVEMNGNTGTIADRMGGSITVTYCPETKAVTYNPETSKEN